MENKKGFKEYLIKTTNGMAKGLFCTLIIGTIIATIAKAFPTDSAIYDVLNSVATLLKNLTGVGIAIGIGLALKFDGLKLVSLAAVGEVGSFMAGTWYYNEGKYEYLYNTFTFKPGDPLTIYLVVVLTAFLVSFILRKETAVDIILVPLLTISIGLVLTLLLSYPVEFITTIFGSFINRVTNTYPFIFGIIIAVCMGMALTAPISSAAIAIAFSINGLAGGAAVCGCCCQMLGFAIMSIHDNKIGSVLSIGIGTSMLQFKNIIRKPIIWLPTIISSAILGPITTCLFKTTCTPSGAGMGTSGLVGLFGVIDSMGSSTSIWLLNIVLGLIVLPLGLVFAIDMIFRAFNIIKKGDLTL